MKYYNYVYIQDIKIKWHIKRAKISLKIVSVLYTFKQNNLSGKKNTRLHFYNFFLKIRIFMVMLNVLADLDILL